MDARGLVVAVLLLVPAGLAAQTVAQAPATVETTVALQPTNLPGPQPPGKVHSMPVNVKYQRSQSAPALDPSNANVTVTLSATGAPTWMDATFDPQTVEFETFNAPLVQNRPVTLNISITEAAPSFTTGEVTMHASAEERPPLQGSEDTRTIQVEAGFVGRLSATVPAGDTVEAAGGFVNKVPIVLENTGNGPLLVQVNVVRSPAEAEITAPTEISLPADEGQRTVTTELEVLVPWKVSESGAVEVEFVPTHATAGVEGKRVEVSFELDGKSAFPVPGPGPWLLVVLAGLAVVLRRRRLD